MFKLTAELPNIAANVKICTVFVHNKLT